MTASTDLKEFLAAYLVEAEEYVSVANAQLLSLEAAQRSGTSDPRALREIFRSLHTIKGLSAMVGVEPIVSIAHRLEAYVREFDRAGTTPPLHATDALLRGVQAIAQRIAALARGQPAQPPPLELLAELDALDPARVRLAEPSRPVLDLESSLLEKLAPFEIEQLVRGIAGGRRALLAHFLPSPERAASGFSINSVRERLASLAEIVRVLPRSVPETPESPGGLAFALIVLTHASDDAVAATVGVSAESLRAIRLGGEQEAAGLSGSS